MGLLEFLAERDNASFLDRDLLDASQLRALGRRGAQAAPDQLRSWQRLLRLVSDPDVLAHLDEPELVATDEGGETRRRPHPKRARAEADIALVEALEGAGFVSAAQIAARPEHAFVAALGGKGAAADPDRLRQVHRQAVLRRNGIHNLVETVRGRIASPYTRALRSDNLSTSVADYFADVPSYQELFGGLNYVSCEHCQSVFGPAAYFLDVMSVIDAYITEPNTIPAGYTLRERRPDLFSRQLTCANTNDLVPFLSIAQEVVAKRVETITKSASAWQDVAIAAYPSNLPFNLPLAQLREYFVAAGATLADGYAAFSPPPATAAKALATPAEVAAETLGLSPDQVALVTTPDAAPASLAARYGFRAAADLSKLDRVAEFTRRTGLSYAELSDLLTQQLSAAELDADVADSFFINATGENLPALAIATDATDPAKPFQKLINVSNARYDRLDRFIRLWRRFGGAFAELDWAMKAAQAIEITPALLTNLAAVSALRAASGPDVSWDQLAALQHEVKTIGRGDGRAPADLFDQVFNNPRLLEGRDPYSSDTPFDPARSYDWTIAEATGDSGRLRDRLAAALSLSNQDAARLGAYVAALQGKSGKLPLDLATLSELYRLALSARLMKLDLASFFLVASLAYYPEAEDPAVPPAGALAPTLETFETLRRTITQVRAAPFTLYQLQYIYTGVAGPYVSTGYRANQIGVFIDDLAETSASLRVTPQALMFETIDEDAAQPTFDALVKAEFLTSLGVLLPKPLDFDALSFLFELTELSFVVPDGYLDEAESKAAFAALVKAKLIIQATGPKVFGKLSGVYTPATPLDFLFPAEPDKRRQVREILDQTYRNIRNTSQTLQRSRAIQIVAANAGLGEFLGATPEMIGLLVPFAMGLADVSTYLAVLMTPLGGKAPPQNVVDLIDLLARANMLFVALDFTPIEVNAVVASPANFGITDTTGLTLDGIWSLLTFKGLVDELQDVNDVLVRCYFGIAPAGSCANGTGVAALAYLTGWPEADIARLIALFWPPPPRARSRGKAQAADPAEPPGWQTVAGLALLNRVFQLSADTSVGVAGLASIAGLAGKRLKTGAGKLDPAAWTAFTGAAEATRAALAARFGATAFDALYRDIEAALLNQQRDALNGFAVWVVSGVEALAAVDTISRLSDYLLLDLEMCGCDSTSYIAQGIGSLQAYMQRARMNLEPGVTDILVPEAWWAWLTAYRIWEANRKIYLYPENYVDPELLQGASPIYYQFKDEILQNEIDETHVAQAYTGYFTGLAEQANLYPVSVYLSATADPLTGEESETHYFFGRTSTEPYAYFHRALSDRGVWTPWRRIDLTINAASLSSVHAFGRLLIFWAETASESGAAIREANAHPQSTVNSILRYSFVDATGAWIQPQTLVSAYVVAAHPNAYLTGFQPASKDAYLVKQYDDAQLWWEVPHVYKLERGLTGAGRITFVAGFDVLSGKGSLFKQQVEIGDRIRCAGQERTVIEEDDDQLVVDQDWSLGAKNAKYVILPKNPAKTRFAPFKGAGKITFVVGFDAVSGNPQTDFGGQLSIGDQITAMGETRTVILIDAADTPPQLVMDLNWGVTGKDVDYTIVPGGSGAERLIVSYGSPIDSAAAPPAGTPPAPQDNPGRDNYLRELNTFNQSLYATLVLSDSAQTLPNPAGPTAGTLAGEVTGGYAVELSEALEGAETRVLSMNWQYSGVLPADLQPYRGAIDRNNGVLRVGRSQNSFADNYWSAAPPVRSQSVAASVAGTPILYNVPPFASWLTPVSNRIGAFVFGFGAESYLAESTEPGLLRLSQTSFAEAFPTSVGSLMEQLVSAGAYTATPIPFDQVKFRFSRLSTTVVDRLSRRLVALGLDGLLSLESQYLPELPFNRFYDKTNNQPGPALDTAHLPPDLMEFDGAYGLYFWEVFFYNVFLIADRLNGNQRFDAAKSWYERIFNPTQPLADGEDPKERYWRFRPFRDLTLDSLIRILTDTAQIAVYENDPFDPHAIARLRPGAYPKAMVMRYVTNLIDWGDMLFAQDTRETITQATELYMLANELLGPRPVQVGVSAASAPKSYDDIKAAYDTKGQVAAATADTVTLDSKASSIDHFYNGLTITLTEGPGVGQVRTIVQYVGATRIAHLARRWSDPPPTTASKYAISGVPAFYIDLENSAVGLAEVQLSDVPFNDLSTYFCVPENAELMAYWDRIEDRLFKIRHCMNIDGVVRSLALFAPPIDVNALVRAAAAGALSPTGGILAEPAVPYYRFEVMIEKARAAAAGVSQLGSALLAALEKQDAEELALISSAQEAAILRLTTQIKEQQIDEVAATAVGLQQAYDNAKTRYDYYTRLITEDLSAGEIQSLDAMAAALVFNVLGSITKTASSIGYAVPQVGSPFAMTYGGQQIGAVLQAAGDVFEISSAISTYISQRSLTTAGYDRRAEEWELQKTLSSLDMAQAQAQIDANAIRQQIAARELVVHKQQIADNAAIAAFLQRKFTNKTLYQWMAGRLSRLFFQSYTLAFDLGRSAERAYQYELGSNRTFLDFGYWDSLKKGLTSGESLTQALDQLDAAYLGGNVRGFEIERTIALSQLDPVALIRLKQTGVCEIALTEKLFDDDYPGHYMRQIASLAVSIPAVIGPYQNIRATLTQLSDTVVLKANVDAVAFLIGASEKTVPADALRTNWWPSQQIAISNGMNDAGVFELSFGDKRYLPFERTGAVSNWRLAIPPQTNLFDVATINDVILTLRYTALDGGGAFRRDVTALPQMGSYAGAVFLPLRQYYPDAWRQFIGARPADKVAQTLAFEVPPSVIPRHLTDVKLKGFYLQLYLADGAKVTDGAKFITFNATDTQAVPVTLTAQGSFPYAFPDQAEPDFAGVTAGARSLVFTLGDVPKDLKTKDGYLDPDKVVGVGLVLDYIATINWK
ncbi:MAG TPA: neuraminidase-like domain-containing protein [Caulobacteraceae bacterium]